MVVHTRDAKEDTIEILSAEHAEECGGILHCFTESWEMAKKALDLGFYISFSGIVTFKNAKEVQEVAKKVPLDRLLIETDAPYLTPHPYRGKSNYPHHVLEVVKCLADMREMPLKQFSEKVYQNSLDVFSLR